MAKIKISGANPSQPPAPIVCSASMFAVFIELADETIQLLSKTISTTPIGASCPCAFHRRISRFFRPEILFASGMNRGCQTMVLLQTAPQKEVGPYSQAQ